MFWMGRCRELWVGRLGATGTGGYNLWPKSQWHSTANGEESTEKETCCLFRHLFVWTSATARNAHMLTADMALMGVIGYNGGSFSKYNY